MRTRNMLGMGAITLEMGAVMLGIGLGVGLLTATIYRPNKFPEQINPTNNQIRLEERVRVAADQNDEKLVTEIYKIVKAYPEISRQELGMIAPLLNKKPKTLGKGQPKNYLPSERLPLSPLKSGTGLKQVNADSRNFLSLDGIYPIVNSGGWLARADCKEPIQTIDNKVTPELAKIIWERIEGSTNFLLNNKNRSNRDALIASFERASEYRDYIKKASCISGLPESLIYGIITAESGANLRGKSKANAKGLVMFVEATAREKGLRINKFVDQRYDPEAIIAGAEYMRILIERHGLVKGIASYNAGIGRVDEIMIKNNGKAGIDSFGDLPSETREYVIRVLTRALIYVYRKELGLNIKQRPLFSEVLANSISHEVRYGETLSTIAREYGVSLRALGRLNPLNSPHNIREGQEIRIPDPAIYSQPLNNSSLFKSH